MKRALAVILVLMEISLAGQEVPGDQVQRIVEEGKMLYACEMASWHGTDLFLEKYPNRANIGGYFSYLAEEVPTCVFFSKSESPKVIGTITFDSTYQLSSAGIDLSERGFTPFENDLYTIRKLALDIIYSDTLFIVYKNTNLNLIPLIIHGERKVYVLTGPTQPGVVIFGNDYVLVFDQDNNLLHKKRLHNNIIPHHYGGQQEKDMNLEGAMHSHLPETGDLITATDICTLMLYAKYANWKTYNVVSEKYISIWNCKTNSLIVVPLDEFAKPPAESENGGKRKGRSR